MFFKPANPNSQFSVKMLDALDVNNSKPKLSSLMPPLSHKRESSQSRKLHLAGSIVKKFIIEAPKDIHTYAVSGETVPVFHNDDLFDPNLTRSCESRTVLLADKSYIKASYFGEVIISFKKVDIRLEHVLLLPDLGYNLVSTT